MTKTMTLHRDTVSHPVRAGLALLCTAVLAACGGGGGGGDGGGGGGGGNTPHTIGGRVDGLTGAGLVLQNNGGNNLAVSAAGNFQFTQTVAHGAAYAVTVLTQPQGQACAVANGSGTANAAVSNVVVTCAAPLTLEGSTPAADATGVDRSAALTLGFSAPVDVSTVAANVTLSRAGRTVPAAAAGSGATVTVTPQSPLMPLATYTVAAATGLRGQGGQTLGSTASVSFTTRDGAWQGAQSIEAGAGDAFDPQIAFDTTGNALAVWQQLDGTRTKIWANRYTAGVGWGTPAPIDADNGGAAHYPQVAIDASGNGLAVWRQFDGQLNSIWANRYTASAGWGTPTRFDTRSAGNAEFPQIAFDTGGNALAVWAHSDGSRTHIWANRFAVGSGWSTPARIETSDTGSAYEPQVAFDASGNALAVWVKSDGTRYNLWANRFAAGAGWGTPVLLESADGGDAARPQLAFDAAGNAIAVWEQHTGAFRDIWTARYTAASGWGTAAAIETTNGADDLAPQLAFDTGGNALAVWQHNDGGRSSIKASRYTAGTGWGTATMAVSDGDGPAAAPQVAFDVNGNALAVWQQSDGTRYNIRANRYTAGTGWGTATPIEADDGPAGAAQIAIDANGNALAVWVQSRGMRVDILTNRLQ